MNTKSRRIAIFCLASLPFAWLVMRIVTGRLGPDPAETVVTFTGEWALYLIFITLTVTPARRWLRWNWLAAHRRMLGLFALFYATLHVAAFLMFILGLDLTRFLLEVVERPYITVGMPAFLILVALGVTSTKGMMRRLGRNWVRLHRLLYLAVVLAWVHILWQVRSSYFEAAVYAVVVSALLLPRLVWWRQRRAKRA